jgi:hypothetical protein
LEVSLLFNLRFTFEPSQRYSAGLASHASRLPTATLFRFVPIPAAGLANSCSVVSVQTTSLAAVVMYHGRGLRCRYLSRTRCLAELESPPTV